MVRQTNKDKRITTTEPKIYGLEVDNNLVYVGKTHVADSNGNLRRSRIQTLYTTPKLNKVIKGKEDKTKIIELKSTTVQEWFKDRNHEAHFRFVNGEIKLLNHPWILEGKNGYWEGKKRDAHTLNRLSESKHKKIIQYNLDGYKVKVWSSAKEAATMVFKDYQVKNGSGDTKLYHLLYNKKIKNKKAFNSYWFREEDLINNFSRIPLKLNIPKLIQSQIRVAKSNRKHTPAGSTLIYTVKRLSKNKKLLQTYNSAVEAGENFNICSDCIRKACKRDSEYLGYYWEYGEKKRRLVNNKGKFTK